MRHPREESSPRRTSLAHSRLFLIIFVVALNCLSTCRPERVNLLDLRSASTFDATFEGVLPACGGSAVSVTVTTDSSPASTPASTTSLTYNNSTARGSRRWRPTPA